MKNRKMDWRLGKSWSEAELGREVIRIGKLDRNFSVNESNIPVGQGWRRHDSEVDVGREDPGTPVPGGLFDRIVNAVTRYEFSDPAIVTAHFDPSVPLLKRRMLLEIRVLGFHYLCGTVVTEVLHRQADSETLFGFRYDTLQGHIERGAEWFLVKKDHATGRIGFRIQALWKPGEFPNLWSELGFRFLAPRYQKKWHRHAHRRLREIRKEVGG